MVPTFARIAKSAIVNSSPANQSLTKKDSRELSKTLTASRRSCEIFFTPARRTGR